jgi:predicted secreted protein
LRDNWRPRETCCRFVLLNDGDDGCGERGNACPKSPELGLPLPDGRLVRRGVRGGRAAGYSLVPRPAGEQASLTEADAGKPIQLKVGQRVQLSLPVQSGTGYSWQAPPKSPLLDLEYGTELFVPKPGAPAVELITATAKSPSFLVLEFQYARPFEKGTPPMKKARFPILITE